MKKRSRKFKRNCGDSPRIGGFLLFLPVLLCVAGLSACAPRIPRLEEPPLPQASDLVDHLRQRTEKTGCFLAQGRLRYTSPNASYYLKFNLMASRPDRFRMRTVDFLGRSQVTIVTNPDRLMLLDHIKAELYEGPAHSGSLKVLGGFLPVTLDLAGIISVLSGNAVISSDQKPEVSRAGPGLWRLSLAGPANGLVQDVYLDSSNLTVERIEFRQAEEEPVLVIGYSEFQQVNGLETPLLIEIRDTGNESDLVLRYNGFTLNPDLPAAAFILSVPAAVKVLPWPE